MFLQVNNNHLTKHQAGIKHKDQLVTEEEGEDKIRGEMMKEGTAGERA